MDNQAKVSQAKVYRGCVAFLWVICFFVGLWGEAWAVPHRWTARMGSPFGINIHVLGWDGDARAQAAIKDLGVGWIRVDFDWYAMEPQKGRYNWAIADGLVAFAVREGLQIFATVAYAPNWAVDNAAPDRRPVPRQASDWQAFLRAVVDRYKGQISHWGIWNEPNLQHFLWFPENLTRPQRIQTYLQVILLPGIQAVRAADADAVVIAPDLAQVASSRIDDRIQAWQPWFEEILKQAGSSLDVISHHTYQSDYTRLLDGTAYPWEWGTVMGTMTAQGFGQKPVWLTEIGWRTERISEADQAREYTDLVKAMLARPWWKKVFPYELKDDANIPEKWGIIRADWTRKPAWTAYRDAILAHQPVPRAGGDRVVRVGDTVTFDGSASSDPDGQIVSYHWDFDHRNGMQIDASGAQVTHRFTTAGEYTVTLTVTDNHGIAIGTRFKVTAQGGNAPTGYPIAHAPPSLQIDGDLSEWSGAQAISLVGKDYIALTGTWGGTSDSSAEVMWMWSPQGLAMAARVTDQTHHQDGAADLLWQGDSLQIALDADGDRAGPGYDGDGDYEFTMALFNNQARWERSAAPTGAPAANLQTAIRRVGNQTIYEVFFPLASISPLRLQANATIYLSFLINDNDGSGRKGWLQGSEGIGREKDPRAFPPSILMPPASSPEIVTERSSEFPPEREGASSEPSPTESAAEVTTDAASPEPTEQDPNLRDDEAIAEADPPSERNPETSSEKGGSTTGGCACVGAEANGAMGWLWVFLVVGLLRRRRLF